MKSVIVVTPGVSGDDGISCLARQIIRSLAEIKAPQTIEVWSWADNEPEFTYDLPSNVRVHTARRNSLRLARWFIREAITSQAGRLVVVLHIHLVPVVLPIVTRGARLVHFLIGIEVWKKLTILQRHTLLRAWKVVGISQHTVHEFKKANPDFAKLETSVCYPGLPDLPGTNSQSERCEFALIVGRMVTAERYKGHDVLLEIWGHVLREVPAARLVVVGHGDDLARLTAKASGLKLAASIEFLGRVSSETLDVLYQRACFLVMPSRNEGFGFVFLEAMRHGKPVIAGSGAGSEIVSESRTGFVVDPEDRQSLTRAVVRLFRDDTLRIDMGESARRRFKEFFTSERFSSRLRDLLSDFHLQ